MSAPQQNNQLGCCDLFLPACISLLANLAVTLILHRQWAFAPIFFSFASGAMMYDLIILATICFPRGADLSKRAHVMLNVLTIFLIAASGACIGALRPG